MAYMIDETKMDRLLAALDGLGANNRVIPSPEAVEFIIALASVRNELPVKEPK